MFTSFLSILPCILKIHLLVIFLVCATENPKVIGSIQRRYFTDKFRNFVDLCVQKNYEQRPSASQLLTHVYLKKMKLSNVVSTLQMSVVSEGLIEVQKKIAAEALKNANAPAVPIDSQSIYDKVADSDNAVIWEF
jgi:hypothetical protein